MRCRAAFASGLALVVAACAAVPTVTFGPDDAASSSGGGGSFDATTIDSATAEGGSTDGSSRLGSPDSSDGAPLGSEAGTASDGGVGCLPPGSPPGTLCCPNGTACIGPACAICNECACALGLYCCARENGGGKVQGTTCTGMPAAMQCPTN